MNSKAHDSEQQRWTRLERLFDAVADLEAAEREAYLAKECGGDDRMREQIEALLHSDKADASVIEHSIRGALLLTAENAEVPGNVVGARIGPYRVVRVIGSGGMGVVYLAERADDHFRQQVAIKVVRQRLVDPEIEARLVGERQILANLDHPNIARLFDGGTTTDGTPYLVMEYIDGVPLDDYCDGCRLDINERLALFRTICSAVHYAHQNLIVHRDIKPGNILVTPEGTPKLLDFGIAKLLDTGGAATRGLTRDGAVMLTPENATPEQVLNRPVTTATDTYALGLLLFKLLTGQAAYQIGNNPSEMAHAICEQVPEKPSIAVARLAARAGSRRAGAEDVSAETVSRRRKTTIDKLRRRLKGDLDNIVLCALRKEPERRYRSVHELSEDIRLHLTSLPVLARTDTWRYRSGKFVRRHVAGVTMSFLLVMLLAAFGVVMTVQNQRIMAERDTAREVSAFLEEIFMAPDPDNARGLEVTAKEILARGADRISDQLAARPLIHATLMETIGRVYLNLGQYEPSIEMLEESLRIRRGILGDEHRDVAASKNELAQSLIRKADFPRARDLLEEALLVNRRDQGESSTAVAANLYNLAEVAKSVGELEEAEVLARDSLAIYSAHGDRYPRELAEATNSLARILRGKYELDEAERLQREAIALVRTHLGEDHPFIAYYLQNLAVVLQTKGDLEAAKELFYESIAATRKILGDEHTLHGGSLVMLGTLLHNSGEFDAAEAALRDALAVHRKARGPEHPFVAYDMTSLAMLLGDKGQLDEAESLLRDAMLLYEKSLGPEHQYLASTLTELGAVLTEMGLPEDAEPLLVRAIDIRRQAWPEQHPLVATTKSVYGHTLARLGRYQEAEELLLDSFVQLSALAEASDRRTRRALRWTISLYDQWDKPEQADRYRMSKGPAAELSTEPQATDPDAALIPDPLRQ